MVGYVLANPERMSAIEGLASPEAFYPVLTSPALLAGMRIPDAQTPWPALWHAGYRHVVCLNDDRPSYDPAPLGLLHSVALQDLFGGAVPDAPSEQFARIEEAVHAVLNAIRGGAGVIVHCEGGTGRTGTIIGGVLCRLGMRSGDAIRHLDAIDRLRGTHWPESPWQGALLERFEDGV